MTHNQIVAALQPDSELEGARGPRRNSYVVRTPPRARRSGIVLPCPARNGRWPLPHRRRRRSVYCPAVPNSSCHFVLKNVTKSFFGVRYWPFGGKLSLVTRA
jgi:hypothetical protein